MKLVAFCIKHRVTTIMACVMIVVFGIVGFRDIPLALLPDIKLPMAVVYSTYQAGPQEIESLVTTRLEAACASVSGMESMQSVSSENIALVMVSFADGTNLDNAMVDLREKLDMAKSALPEDATDPVVMALDVDALPVMQIGLKGADLSALQSIAEDTISPALERIDGVASVDIMGGYTNEIAVETYNEKLAGYGLSLNYISQILSAENLTIPAGNVNSGANSLAVRTDGSFSSVEDVANCLIPLPSGGSVRLGEVADVSMRQTERTTIAKVDGQDCVILSINKQSGVNTVNTAQKCLNALNKVTAELPTLEWSILMDQRDFISLATESAITNILLGVLLAAIVLFLFLRDWGATLVISVAMPLCIVAVFLVMQVLDITMNMMSLGGVAMGVGMIVDNSIVVLENIFHYKSDGYNNYDACTQGTGEVGLSIMASTLTTVAVFLPLGVTNGIVGMMVRDFCLTICTLMLMSLVVSLTIVPLLSYILLGHAGQKDLTAAAQAMEAAAGKVSRGKRLIEWYRTKLAYLIHHRALAFLTSFAILALSGAAIYFSGFEFIPMIDQSTVSISLSLPTGSETAEAQYLAERAVDIVLQTVPETDSVYYTTGGGTLSSLTGGDSTSVTVNLVPSRNRHRSAEEIGQALRRDLSVIAGAEISVSSAGMLDMSSMTGSPINVSVSGNDYDLLEEITADLTAQIAALPDAVDVTSSAGEQEPEVNVHLKRDVASQYGLTAATVGTAVRSQLTGSTATLLKVNGEEISVIVKGQNDAGKNLDALKSMPITTPLGSSVPLRMVADVTVEMAPHSISRQNQSRTLTITGDSATDDSTGIARSVKALVEDYPTPDGITVDVGGESEEIMEAFKQLGKALIVAVGLVYFVLASQFESFLMPVIVMMILPVSLIGSLCTQGIFGLKISIIAFVGVIMLAGVVVNSSIVLVDYINIRRSRGEDKETAILNACPRRVRPVMMTMLTTVLGLLPMAIGYGSGAELMRPMAICMMTGMLLSTVVTLFFTPVFYSLLDQLGHRKKKEGGLLNVQNQ